MKLILFFILIAVSFLPVKAQPIVSDTLRAGEEMYKIEELTAL